MAVMKKKKVSTTTNTTTQKRRFESWDSFVESNNNKRRKPAEINLDADFPPGFERVVTQSSTDLDDDDDTCCSSPDFMFPHKKYFTEFNSSLDTTKVISSGEEEFRLLPFEDEEYEDSYNALRQREKKLILHDHIFEYSKLPVYGSLVLRQRSIMVDWMIQASKVHSLHYETLFLGVSLLDRFLAKGFFKNEKSMQVLGIACLKLAAKIEENQGSLAMIEDPFFVGENEYCYLEVIGMEWFVQEVLRFHCIVPTVYNFLDYYLKAAKADVELQRKARHMAVLSLTDHRRLWFSPSTVAAGLVIIASLALNGKSSCQSVIKTHLRNSMDQLQMCIQSLEVGLDKQFHLDVLFVQTEACMLLSSLMESASKACNQIANQG